MMSAAEVHPLHFMEIRTELFFHRFQCHRQIIRVLLAQRMEMYSVQTADLFLRHLPLQSFQRCPQPGERRAGIVDRMSLLSGALRVDAQPHAASCSPDLPPVFPDLSRRIKHDMITVLQDLVHLFLTVCRGKDMVLLPHLLIPQPRLIQPARRRSGQVLPDQRIQRIHRKCLLCQKDMAPRLILDLLQDLQILPYPPLLHHKTRRLKFPSLHNPLPSKLQSLLRSCPAGYSPRIYSQDSPSTKQTGPVFSLRTVAGRRHLERVLCALSTAAFCSERKRVRNENTGSVCPPSKSIFTQLAPDPHIPSTEAPTYSAHP